MFRTPRRRKVDARRPNTVRAGLLQTRPPYVQIIVPGLICANLMLWAMISSKSVLAGSGKAGASTKAPNNALLGLV